MRYFFPATFEYIDPLYDFDAERHGPGIQQSDYWYPHEALSRTPYDGILLSRALVLSTGGKGRSTYRWWRKLYHGGGARAFLHLSDSNLDIMGDCGAYTYVNEPVPPLTVEDAIDFYTRTGVSQGLSPDHLIPGFRTSYTADSPDPVWLDRFDITITYAHDFWEECKQGHADFDPIGVAQAWDVSSYATAVALLQKIGYRYIAIGGLTRLSITDMAQCLEAIRLVRYPSTRLHLLGITPVLVRRLTRRWGIYSFDCTMPFRQAFLNERDNYHTRNRTYLALRVPRVSHHAGLRRRIHDGDIAFVDARRLERAALDALYSFARDESDVDDVLSAVQRYEGFFNGNDHTDAYRDLLRDQPWRSCPCAMCRTLGIDIVIFRDKQRNNRRGFHNLHVFYDRIRNDYPSTS